MAATTLLSRSLMLRAAKEEGETAKKSQVIKLAVSEVLDICAGLLYLLQGEHGTLVGLDAIMQAKTGNRLLTGKAIASCGYYQSKETHIRQREQAVRLFGAEIEMLKEQAQADKAVDWEQFRKYALQIPLWDDRLPRGPPVAV